MTTIGFLHTAEVHVATFRGLFAELAPPGLADLHLVDEALLADARRTGSAPGLAGRLRELAAAGADLIVCTCSTIGAEAEATPTGVPVVRLDRPMAEAAVAMGDRIAVVATVESTVEPTMALIQATAEQLATPIPATTERAVPPTPATAEQPATPIPATTERAIPPTPATAEQPATPIPATTERAIPPTPATAEQPATP
ncbi:aspartate/glutamate racemase family protein, partial [Actinoplanes philippinensis]|uniref:aspartate/glutamate racemase family protein n=1 Tax=Actinoplanes philippinensis TaxID=35752 RepID=UPI003407ED9E